MTGAIANLHPDLLAVLTELERRMGFELRIDSGYRDPTHNEDVGGVEGSEHTHDPAEAADVFCQRSNTRYKMVRALVEMGVRRIGIGKTFVHIGISSSHPQDVCWHYYPNK
ncbi:MAG: peptidase M15 [Nitrospira sp. WS238]|nr:peptidase M15 [Nitrospira sp. WS238]